MDLPKLIQKNMDNKQCLWEVRKLELEEAMEDLEETDEDRELGWAWIHTRRDISMEYAPELKKGIPHCKTCFAEGMKHWNNETDYSEPIGCYGDGVCGLRNRLQRFLDARETVKVTDLDIKRNWKYKIRNIKDELIPFRDRAYSFDECECEVCTYEEPPPSRMNTRLSIKLALPQTRSRTATY